MVTDAFLGQTDSGFNLPACGCWLSMAGLRVFRVQAAARIERFGTKLLYATRHDQRVVNATMSFN